MHSYDGSIAYRKQLQKTEKLQLYNGGITTAMLTATYLYSQNFEKKDTRDEVFIVGIHLSEDSFKARKIDGNSLTLNGQTAKEIVQLELNDERLKEISFVTEWSSYYLVTFPHMESKSLTLLFKDKVYGEGKFDFAKVAKYVLKKEIL